MGGSISQKGILKTKHAILYFSNQLMRDTVYSILLEEQRSEMHHKVAKFIEASVGVAYSVYIYITFSVIAYLWHTVL